MGDMQVLKVLLHSHFPESNALPMQAIAVELTNRGHDVRWLTSAIASDYVCKTRAVHFPTYRIENLDIDLHFEGETGLHDDDPKLQDFRVFSQVEDYRRALTDFKADVLLVDVWPNGAKALWELGKAPAFATLGVMPMYTSHFRGPYIMSGKAPSKEPVGCLINGARQLMRRWVVYPMKLKPIIDRQRQIWILPKLKFREPPESFWYSPTLHIQASSNTLEFDQQPKGVDRVEFMGPLVTPTKIWADQLPEWWRQVVIHKKVIGITQGALARDPGSLIVPTIHALATDPSNLVVVVSPHAKEAEAQLEGPIQNVLFANWIPYHLFFPRLNLLITDGGYGAITQALSHKVPLICTGQPDNKKDTVARVIWAGVGIDLKTAYPSAQKIKKAADKILPKDSSYRANAEKLGAELTAAGGASRAVDLLEELARAKKKPPQVSAFAAFL